VTCASGVFVAVKYICVVAVGAEGLYLATNPSSSFFYVLTVTHALHVLGGLGGIVYVIRKLGKSSREGARLDGQRRATGFSDMLWLYLALLALGEAVDDSKKLGGTVSKADSTLEGHADRPVGRTGVLDLQKSWRCGFSLSPTP